MDVEARAMRRVTWRLLPLLIVCYFIAFLDRVNIGFASLTMNKDLGFTATVFGQAAGVFFISYVLFEVPSNLALEKFGASKWIARIMLTWGILSGCMALVRDQWSFMAVRFLLGAAEAGFFPGIIFYFTLWFPARYRGRVIGYFAAGIPLSGMFGAPISGALLKLDGINGLHGWQWMFILEAVPAVLLSVVVFFMLTDRPSVARWLPPAEKEWLRRRLRDEARRRDATQADAGLLKSLLEPKVLLLCVVYFGVLGSIYGASFFLPQIVAQFGFDPMTSSWVTSIPFTAGALACVFWGRDSDVRGERKVHLMISLAVGVAGLAAFGFMPTVLLKLVALTVAAAGIYSTMPAFLAMPPAFLRSSAAAGAIAMINAMGNVSGYYAPALMGYLKDKTGGYDAGLMALSVMAVMSFVVTLVVRHDRQLEQAPAVEPEMSPAE